MIWRDVEPLPAQTVFKEKGEAVLKLPVRETAKLYRDIQTVMRS
jgi:hypothetical protein